MEVASLPGGGAVVGSSGGGPAPFLLKTYDMVDDSSTDEIVSWSSSNNSFVVWSPPEFARDLLPAYFKHNNFSSFIRQLNTYGFRKIDPERWEFANEDFVKDQKHLLKNIHRRKPIHSHSHPQGSQVDSERAAFDEEIERLSRDKAALEANVLRFNQQRSAVELQLEDLSKRVGGMEQRQESLLSFLQKAIQNRTFVDHLTQKVESMDFSAYSKKRRLPRVDDSQQLVESSFLDNYSSSRSELGNPFQQDFSSKLNLELSPAVSDVNLVSHSTQSSNEDGGSPRRNTSEGDPKDAPMMGCPLLAPETLELSDTGTSFKFTMETSFMRKTTANESPRTEENDGHISCHLNLTLASSQLQAENHSSARMLQPGQEVGKFTESRSNADNRETDFGVLPKNRNPGEGDSTLSMSKDTAPITNQGPAAAQTRVNDVFWEQFLTERPGSSDTEEASSNLRAKLYLEQEDERSGLEMSRNGKSMDQLTL